MSTVSGTPAEETVSRRDIDTGRLYASLGPLPSSTGHPALIVLSGLPGSGKSFFCHRLAAEIPTCVVLESDALRFALVDAPAHSGEESARLFGAIHRVLDKLLRQRHQVVLDATNLRRRNRKRLYQIAERHGADVLIVELTAPETVIRQRLFQREADLEAARETGENSTAGIDVYDRMAQSAQPVRRSHITIDTSQDIGPALHEVAAQLEGRGKPTAADGI